MSNEIVKSGNTNSIMKAEFSIEEVKNQVNKIQSLMKSLMKDGEHYGTIPGTKKPTLLKAGAEKLGFTFRLSPKFEINEYRLENKHREYVVKCSLIHVPTGQIWGEGVGSCSTLENKYRYRWENTGQPVPEEYWKTKDPELLGGDSYTARKSEGKWYIFHRVEHDNPADYYNIVLKIAKKRAHVDAILTATAASDIFTQDVEEMKDIIHAEVEIVDEEPKEQAVETKRKITQKQQKRLFAIAKENNLTNDDVKAVLNSYGYEKSSEIIMDDYDKIIEDIKNFVSKEFQENLKKSNNDNKDELPF